MIRMRTLDLVLRSMYISDIRVTYHFGIPLKIEQKSYTKPLYPTLYQTHDFDDPDAADVETDYDGAETDGQI